MARGTGTKRGSRQPQPQQQRFQQPIMIPQIQQTQPGVMQQQQQQQQQYHQVANQPIVVARSPQQIMIQQVQMPVRMPQQPSSQGQPQQGQQQPYYRLANQQTVPTSPQQPQIIVQPGQMPIRMQQQQQQQLQQQQQYQHISAQQALPTSPSQPIIAQQVQMPRMQQPHPGVQTIRKQMVPVGSWNQSPSPQQQQRQQQQQQQLLHQQQQQQQIQQQQPQTIRIGTKKQAIEPSTFALTEQSLRDPLVAALERNMGKHFFSHTLHRTFGPTVAQIIQ